MSTYLTLAQLAAYEDHCTHGGEAMHLEAGSRCPWCLNIVTEAALPPAAGHRDGEGAEALVALVARTALPVATLAAASVPEAGAVAPPEVAASTSGTPVARSTDPDTSWHAANKAKTVAAEDRIKCLMAHVKAGDSGLTGDELEQVTGRPYQSIGPRRPWLEDNGFIEKAHGVKRANRAGNAEQVYRITPAGYEMAAKLEAEAA